MLTNIATNIAKYNVICKYFEWFYLINSQAYSKYTIVYSKCQVINI